MTSIDRTPNPPPRDGGREPLTPPPPPVIFSYTRAQAVADGALADVTATAKEVGFLMPVAITAAVWGEYVNVPDGVAAQDEAGRLWDVLNMLRFAVRRDTGGKPELLFQLHVRNDNAGSVPPLVTLKAVCGPSDDLSPCITVMLPDED